MSIDVWDWKDSESTIFWNQIHDINTKESHSKLSKNIYEYLSTSELDSYKDYAVELSEIDDIREVKAFTERMMVVADRQMFVQGGDGKQELKRDERPSVVSGKITSSSLGCDEVTYVHRPAFENLSDFDMYQCQSVNRILGCSLSRCRTRLLLANNSPDNFNFGTFKDICLSKIEDMNERDAVTDELKLIDVRELSAENIRAADSQTAVEENVVIFFSCRKHRFHFPYNLAQKLFTKVSYSTERYRNLAMRYRDSLNETRLPDSFQAKLTNALGILKEDYEMVVELENAGDTDVKALEQLLVDAVKYNNDKQADEPPEPYDVYIADPIKTTRKKRKVGGG